MAHLTRITTEVFFNAQGATRTSLLVTTLSKDPSVILAEARRKARACYGLDIHNLRLGHQSFL